MKILFDLFPVILFFVAYHFTGDIFIATPVSMAASLAQIMFLWFRQGKIDTLLWISFLLISILGGATMIFQDRLFIYWKPTVLYWILALGLFLAKTWKRINPVKQLFGKEITLPEPIWERLNLIWICFFIMMGSINLFVAFYFSESTWVNFKLFGTLGLTLIFIVAQSLFLSRYLSEKDR